MPTPPGCSIACALGQDSAGDTTGQLALKGWGLAPNRRVTLEVTVPNLMGYTTVIMTDDTGAFDTGASTVFVGPEWHGQFTLTLEVWPSQTGVVGKGQILASSTCSITLQ
jgi:hypothetical protein